MGHDGHAHGVGAIDRSLDESIAVDVRRWVWAVVGVCVAVVLVGLVVLWPGGDTQVVDPLGLDTAPVRASVVDVEEVPCSFDPLLPCASVELVLDSGERAGERLVMEQPATTSIGDGDGILVTIDALPDGTEVVDFYDFQRRTPLILLAIVFVTVIVLLGGWRGVGALAGLAASLLVIVVFALPALLEGTSPVVIALVTAGAIATLALFLAHGINLATATALLSTLASLALTGVVAWVFVGATKLTGLADESAAYLDALGTPIDLQGLVLAGVVIGSLGVLDDVTVTQVSAVWELERAAPGGGFATLYRRAVRIGRDHISSTVNTLFLAYAGAALPLLLLFREASQSVGSVATREIVAVEIVRALVGSIGLVASVPISTALAAKVVSSTIAPTLHDPTSHTPTPQTATPDTPPLPPPTADPSS